MIYRADGVRIKPTMGFLRGFRPVRDEEMREDAVATLVIYPDIYLPYESGKRETPPARPY